ncbi:MAG: phosphate acetyltransferase [Ilumatobacter fluminis]|uniref:phosphate acetyltransferase n=1 Tax=Ilumatobacter fluminis TaxID=467091 RepID=UPI0032F091E0
MTRAVYLTAMGPASGKSLVALGLVELLSRRVGRVGFFRPVVQSADDNDLALIRARYDLPDERCGYAFTDSERSELGNASRAGMARVVERFRQIEAVSDFVVVEGTDFTGASSPIELDVNLRISEHLGAPIVVVVNGHDRGVDEIVERFRVGRDSFGDDAISAMVVNRVGPSVLGPLRERLAQQSSDDPVWAVPELPELRQPSLAQLQGALGAELVAGDPDDLTRSVGHVKVAAMSVPNMLDHVEDDTVFIAPGDRPDVVLAAMLTRTSAAYPSVSGVLLSGGLRPDDRVTSLIAGMSGGVPVPLLSVSTDSFDTAIAANEVEGAITPGDRRKIDVALAHLEEHVDLAALGERIEVGRSDVVTPIMFEYDLIERAKAAKAHIVLPEGTDDRILRAADRICRRQVCDLTLLGPQDQIRTRIADLGLALGDVPIIDPLDSDLTDRFAKRYHELRAHKGITLDRAHDILTDVSFFGTMMVYEGLADGMVSGAAHTTAHTIRPALEFVKTRPGTSIVSSVFLMLLADRVLVYGDCAVNPDPNADELADIATSSADTASMFGIEPRIAMLSYSTGASGTGADVDKVRAATERVRELRPDLKVEGPIQYDAAVDVDVARSKLPGSDVAGQATVFIFPDLNTGNNTYKAVQRSADAVAVGPVLQGLNKPVNDLSRGALVADIVNTIAITAIQAGVEHA